MANAPSPGGHSEPPRKTPNADREDYPFRYQLELLTNFGPLLFSVVLLWSFGREFFPVLWSAAVGIAAVAMATFLNLYFVRSRNVDLWFNVREMQPIFDKASWFLMAAVLLISAVDAMNLALNQRGISSNN